MKQAKWFLLLHVILGIYAGSSVCSKLAAQQPFLSAAFIVLYGLMLLALVVGGGAFYGMQSQQEAVVLDAAEQKIYAVRRGRSAQSMASIGVVLQGVLDHLSELSANGGKTLPVGLMNLMRAQNAAAQYGQMYAGLVLVMLPTLILYICVQKKLTQGMTLGGVDQLADVARPAVGQEAVQHLRIEIFLQSAFFDDLDRKSVV